MIHKILIFFSLNDDLYNWYCLFIGPAMKNLNMYWMDWNFVHLLPQRMNPPDFGDPLSFPQVPPQG